MAPPPNTWPSLAQPLPFPRPTQPFRAQRVPNVYRRACPVLRGSVRTISLRPGRSLRVVGVGMSDSMPSVTDIQRQWWEMAEAAAKPWQAAATAFAEPWRELAGSLGSPNEMPNMGNMGQEAWERLLTTFSELAEQQQRIAEAIFEQMRAAAEEMQKAMEQAVEQMAAFARSATAGAATATTTQGTGTTQEAGTAPTAAAPRKATATKKATRATAGPGATAAGGATKATKAPRTTGR